MHDKYQWIKDYSYALSFGVFFIIIAGIIANTESSGTNLTGFNIYESQQVNEQFVKSGSTKSFHVVSDNCALTPRRMYANVGDKIILSAEVHDDQPHRISAKEWDVDLIVRGSEVKYAEFYAARSGKFEVVDAFPCQSQGFDSKALIIVS